MSGVKNEFMQDTLISLGAVLGISCIVRVCCVRFYHRRRMQQQSQGQGQSPITPSDGIQHPLPSAPLPMQQMQPMQSQYVVYTGGPYPLQQHQQQIYYMPPPVPHPQHV